VLPPLYVLSGIGGDSRLFDGLRRVRDIRAIDWIAPMHSHESLVNYALRLAREVKFEEPFDLGGASFGGMLALELARHVKPRRVFLFGSCRSPGSIARSLALLRFAAPIVPDRLLNPPRFIRAPLARWFGATSREHVDLFAGMLAATPPPFIRWASHAIFTWAGIETLPMPVHHVHGSRDHLIPLRCVHADRVVAGGGHLLTLTHADAVNAFIRGIDENAGADDVATRCT
jgi:pimeloyl-ACP methyl ester carboxylesterase